MITGILYLSIGSLTTTGEYCIIPQPGDQRYPAIYQDTIVYQDNRNGNCDIYGYNLETGEEFQITTDLNDQLFPDIYGNIVVWLDKRDPQYHIYAYNLLTGEEWKISDSSAWRDPAIHGSIIVWSGGDKREQIHGYNLETEQEFLVCENDYRQCNPEIFESIVVWEAGDPYPEMIQGYDLAENKEYVIRQPMQFVSVFHDQRNPVIFNETVIWIVEYDGDIFGRNLIDSEDFIIAAAQYGNCEDLGIYDRLLEPALYENMVVWTDCRNGNRDIYGLDLSTFQEFQITSHAGIQQCPALYKNLVIWEDNRRGTWDIYGYDLSMLPKIVPVPSRTHLVRVNFYSQILLSAVSIGIFIITVKILLDSFRFKDIPEPGPWSKKTTRDFKRDKISLHAYIAFIIMCGVFGLLLFWQEGLFGSFIMAFFVLCSGIILWNVTFPYVRTTQTGIIIYESFLLKETIRWDAIDRIEYDQDKKKIELRVSTRVFRIDLFRMDQEDRDDFITTLRYPPLEGIEFVYSTD